MFYSWQGLGAPACKIILESESQACVNLPILLVITGQGLGYITVEGNFVAQVIGTADSQIAPGAVKVELSGHGCGAVAEVSIYITGKFMGQAQTGKVSAVLACLTCFDTQSAHNAGEGILRNVAFQSTGAVKVAAAQSADGQLCLRLEVACCFTAEAFAVLAGEAEAVSLVVTLNGSSEDILGFEIIGNSANLSGQVNEFVIADFLTAVEAKV